MFQHSQLRPFWFPSLEEEMEMFEVGDDSFVSQYASKSRGERALNVTFTVLQLSLATAFLVAGVSKLVGVQIQVEIFEKIGVGQWFRYVTGGVEVLFALLVLIPRTALFASMMLVGTMSAAIVSHVLVIGGSPVPALVLLATSVAVAWYHGMYICTR
jgi:putative oxidoreductase